MVLEASKKQASIFDYFKSSYRQKQKKMRWRCMIRKTDKHNKMQLF